MTVACLCPGGTRHPNGDTIVFAEIITFRKAMLARKSIGWAKAEDDGVDVPDVLALLAEFYLIHLIESWSIRDEKGKPVEVNRANVEKYVLASEAAFDLAEFADELYQGRILGPLAQKASSSSPDTSTNGSTSAMPGPTKTSRKKPSTPSSTAPITMAATGRT